MFWSHRKQILLWPSSWLPCPSTPCTLTKFYLLAPALFCQKIFPVVCSLYSPSGRLESQGVSDPREQPSPSDKWELAHHSSDGMPTVVNCLIAQALLTSFPQVSISSSFIPPPTLITCTAYFFSECPLWGISGQDRPAGQLCHQNPSWAPHGVKHYLRGKRNTNSMLTGCLNLIGSFISPLETAAFLPHSPSLCFHGFPDLRVRLEKDPGLGTSEFPHTCSRASLLFACWSVPYGSSCPRLSIWFSRVSSIFLHESRNRPKWIWRNCGFHCPVSMWCEILVGTK